MNNYEPTPEQLARLDEERRKEQQREMTRKKNLVEDSFFRFFDVERSLQKAGVNPERLGLWILELISLT